MLALRCDPSRFKQPGHQWCDIDSLRTLIFITVGKALQTLAQLSGYPRCTTFHPQINRRLRFQGLIAAPASWISHLLRARKFIVPSWCRWWPKDGKSSTLVSLGNHRIDTSNTFFFWGGSSWWTLFFSPCAQRSLDLPLWTQLAAIDLYHLFPDRSCDCQLSISFSILIWRLAL